MKKKPFLITVDTEGDNIWNYRLGQKISTENVKFLPRFQNLCNSFGFKPTYLVNYEIISDDKFVMFARNHLKSGNCEIGMHLHAWNSPPHFDLGPSDSECGLPYIVEYPENIIEAKVKFLTELIEERIGVKPTSHRAGRWSTNEIYARVLQNNGYKFDCSITSGLSWLNNRGYLEGSSGNDYRHEKNYPSPFYETSILEIPLQGYKNKRFKKENSKSLKTFVKNLYYSFKRKEVIVLRPNGRNLSDLLYIVKKNHRSNQKYLMFMLHSSEFMPGGSPTFKTKEDIEKLYSDLEVLFAYINKHYFGMTVSEFGESRLK